ncbi:biliverdin-producing heme oxygenase [uncultured Enterovirga sp.]|uniref:biliverdin-producing heme oxygenase n=1 Tax=uncultured Enterovirga sp. TaxID=2026352 RepID=UPI0035C95CB6
MSARAFLRATTRQDHEQVDRIYARFDLTTVAGYRCFLSAIATAHLPVEAALDRWDAHAVLPDWTGRRRAEALRIDLIELGAATSIGLHAPDFPSVPALLGGLYVLEGSRLGGAMLRRSLPPGSPARFLGAAAEPGSWRMLLDRMDWALQAPHDVEIASAAARAVFRVFAAAGDEICSRSADRD